MEKPVDVSDGAAADDKAAIETAAAEAAAALLAAAEGGEQEEDDFGDFSGATPGGSSQPSPEKKDAHKPFAMAMD